MEETEKKGEEEWVRIFGFGSLLSKRSARSTMPNLRHFRTARLSNWRRVFAHVAPIFFERGIARLETLEISSISVEPCPGSSLIVSTFEIPSSELPAFYKREHEFRFVWVPPSDYEFLEVPHNNNTKEETTDKSAEDASQTTEHAEQPNNKKSRGLICARFSDEEYFKERCGGKQEEYEKHYGRWGITKIWRDDIFPCRLYLRQCVLAAGSCGAEVRESFLKDTYLGDRKTTIEKYLELHPEILLEQPPESLRERYNG